MTEMPLFVNSQGKKVLIFHIGDHKTGSTAIQLALAQNRVSLQGKSLFYPAELNNNVLKSHCIAYADVSQPIQRKKAARLLRQLADQVRQSDADFVVISAEELEGVSPTVFAEVVDVFFADAADEIRIIGYVRPHAPRILSSYSEKTKLGIPYVLNSSLEQFSSGKMLKGNFLYLQRFTNWRSSFEGRFLLRPMVRSELFRSSVVEDFAHYAFGGIACTINGGDAANESLCLEDLMRLKVLQQNLDVARGLKHRLGWEIARLIGHMPPPVTQTKLRLHRSLAKEIFKTYLQDAKAMDQAFFGGKPLLESELHSAVENAIDAPQPTEPKDVLSESELRSLTLMSGLIAGLLDAPEVNWPNFLHGKRIAEVQAGKCSQVK